MLGIPQYAIAAVLTGGGVSWVGRLAGGLDAILVLVVALLLLFKNRYPRDVFDLLLGFNRWAFRAGAYALLMTPEYPPFRLDMGGQEPPADASQGDVPHTPVPAV